MPLRSTNSRAFEAFLEDWLTRQETLLHDLLSAQESLDEGSDDHEDEIRGLTARVLAHYQEYFEEKSRMANRNVFLMFSPTWFTPLEKAFLWIAGFKPCLALNLVMNSVSNLTEDQRDRLEELKFEIKGEEKVLVDEFAKMQESVAAPPLEDQARQDGARGWQPVDGRVTRAVDTVLEELKTSMENLIIQADMLRIRAAEKVLSILSPVQSVRFLAAAAQLQLKIRTLGKQKEAEGFHNAPSNGW